MAKIWEVLPGMIEEGKKARRQSWQIENSFIFFDGHGLRQGYGCDDSDSWYPPAVAFTADDWEYYDPERARIEERVREILRKSQIVEWMGEADRITALLVDLILEEKARKS